jgi:hypothetical protein
MELLITKLEDSGYLVERVSGQGAARFERKERAINVLEMEESLLRQGLSEAEVARAVAQLETQPSIRITRPE